MLIYLAGPIFGCADSECRDWRATVRGILADYVRHWDHDVIDPMDRDYRGREDEPGIAREVVEGDKDDIRRCDVVLVYYDHPSVGTSMEVFYAHSIGKRVVVFNVTGGRLSPWLRHHATRVCATLEDAVRECAPV